MVPGVPHRGVAISSRAMRILMIAHWAARASMSHDAVRHPPGAGESEAALGVVG